MNKTITVQKPNAFFFQCQYIRWVTFPSYDKTTTTVRITIHNKCNKYNKSEMNTEMNKNHLLIHIQNWMGCWFFFVGFFLFVANFSLTFSFFFNKVLENLSYLVVKHEIVSLVSLFSKREVYWCVTGNQHSFWQVSSYSNRQQTITRGNLLKRKYREHPLSVQSHGLRSDATGEHPLHPL